MPIQFFRPARYTSGARWYVIYYQTHPQTQQLVRHRESFDLGRIKDIKERHRMAAYWCRQVNKKLPLGYPYEDLIRQKEEVMTLAQALDLARDIKCDTERFNTAKCYRTAYNLLHEWAKGAKLLTLPITAFDAGHAQKYLDWLRRPRKKSKSQRQTTGKAISNTTWNGYLNTAKILWKVLEDRDIVLRSPWRSFKNRRAEPKQRIAIVKADQVAMIDWMFVNDRDLLACVLHIYYMLIRPVELRRLRVMDVNYVEGTVTVPAVAAKHWRERTATVPQHLTDFLQRRVEHANPNAYLFGSGLAVHMGPGGRNGMYQRHVKALKACGLDASSGLTLYSWKDAGITLIARAHGLFLAQAQAGHQDPRITQRYVERSKFEPRLAALDGGLIDMQAAFAKTDDQLADPPAGHPVEGV